MTSFPDLFIWQQLWSSCMSREGGPGKRRKLEVLPVLGRAVLRLPSCVKDALEHRNEFNYIK